MSGHPNRICVSIWLRKLLLYEQRAWILIRCCESKLIVVTSESCVYVNLSSLFLPHTPTHLWKLFPFLSALGLASFFILTEVAALFLLFFWPVNTASIITKTNGYSSLIAKMSTVLIQGQIISRIMWTYLFFLSGHRSITPLLFLYENSWCPFPPPTV